MPVTQLSSPDTMHVAGHDTGHDTGPVTNRKARPTSRRGEPARKRPRRPGRIDIDELPVPVDGSLSVTAWDDPHLAVHGHDARSSYVELFWLGVLGPASTMLLRRLAIGLDHSPDGYLLPVVDTARSLGLGVPKSRQAHFVRALHRCAAFRVVRFVDDGLQVRRQLPTLNAAQLGRLPESLQTVHAEVIHRHRPDQVARLASDPPAAVASRQRANVHTASDSRLR